MRLANYPNLDLPTISADEPKNMQLKDTRISSSYGANADLVRVQLELLAKLGQSAIFSWRRQRNPCLECRVVCAAAASS